MIVTHYNILEKIYENEDKKMEQNTHFENSMIVRYNLNFDWLLYFFYILGFLVFIK